MILSGNYGHWLGTLVSQQRDSCRPEAVVSQCWRGPGDHEREYVRQGSLHLLARAPAKGWVNVPFFCNEDWGWWLKVERGGFKMALCLYSDPDAEGNPERYGLMPSIQKETK